MSSPGLPKSWLSTGVVTVIAVVWIYFRLFLFEEQVLPITFVLPLLIAVWTRRHWHVWAMASCFVLAAAAKVFWVMPPSRLDRFEDALLFGSTVFNVVVGGIVVHLLIRMRLRVAADVERITAQHSELEAQAEELSQQNEEIRVQSEELAQQNEEIGSQSEELTGQNEDLQRVNQRLANREEILQVILESTRTGEGGGSALVDVCRRGLSIIGNPVHAIGLLTLQGAELRMEEHASVDGVASLPEVWPRVGSIAGLALEEGKTVYVSDLGKEPRVAAPFAQSDQVRSVLATPLRMAGVPFGVLVACSLQESHWTQEQFRIVEWVAAQCGLLAETLRSQDELARRAQKLEEANRAKDQFLAMLSHELRTPLTPVLAAAGVLENDPRLPEDAREDLRMIRRNATIQSRLVDDLLDVTKLERGKLDLDRENLNVAHLLKQTAAIVSADVDARNQRLVLEIDDVADCFVNGDGARLQQVFWNLLKNAIKFSPVTGKIELIAKVSAALPPTLAVEIRDSGIGLDAANLDRIFRPFEQVLDGGKQRNGDSGLGLGLAIAKAVVELHHGSIRASSSGPGCGATFTVELPLASAAVAKANGTMLRGAEHRVTDRAAQTILLVEDHGDTGRVLARLLKNAGYAVEHCDTAAAALEMAARERFDVIVSDVGLPDMSGLELMPRLRAQQPWVRGVCLSGYGTEDDLQACRAAGFSEHLTKPVDMQRLQAAIRRAQAVVAV
ncbi:MAG: ATP-binding protein [Opitutus sp.]